MKARLAEKCMMYSSLASDIHGYKSHPATREQKWTDADGHYLVDRALDRQTYSYASCSQDSCAYYSGILDAAVYFPEQKDW